MRSRVPAEYCPDVEAETRARGAVVWCERLRPDVRWGRIRGVEGAPPAAGEPDGGNGGEAVHAGNVVGDAQPVHQNAAEAI